MPEEDTVPEQEMFFPMGSLSLTKEQSDQVHSALGKTVNSIPLFRVTAVVPEDRYVHIFGMPDLAGIVVHYGPQPSQEQRGGQVIASVLDEMVSHPSAVFAAHTKLMAPREDVKRAPPRAAPKGS